MKTLHRNVMLALVLVVVALVSILAYAILNKGTDTKNNIYPASALSVEEYKEWCRFILGDPDPTIGVTLDFIYGGIRQSTKNNSIIPPQELVTYHQLRQEVYNKRSESVMSRYYNENYDEDEFFEEYKSINREYNEKFNQLEQGLLETYNIDMTEDNGCDGSTESYI